MVVRSKDYWVSQGLLREIEFLKVICPMAGLSARVNPNRWYFSKAIDMYINGRLADLKAVSSSFFLVGRYYGMNPQYVVAINHSDFNYYRKESRNPDIYFWVRLKGQKRQFYGKTYQVKRMHCLCRVEFEYLERLVDDNKVPLHRFKDIRPGDTGYRDAYLFDLRSDGFEWLFNYDDPYDIQWCFLDLETTGYNPAGGAVILSIGVVAGKDTFYTLVKPSRESWEKAMPKALGVNGLNWKDVKKGKPLDQAGEELAEFLVQHGVTQGRSLFAGHGIGMDMRFLRYYLDEPLVRAGVSLEGSYVDLTWFYRLLAAGDNLPKLESYSADTISMALGLRPEKRPHNALAGAKCGKRNLQAMIKQFNRLDG